MISFHLNSFLLKRTQRDRTINNIKNKLLEWRAGGGGGKAESTVKLRFSCFVPFFASHSPCQRQCGKQTGTQHKQTWRKFMFVCAREYSAARVGSFPVCTFNLNVSFSSTSRRISFQTAIQCVACKGSSSIILMLPCLTKESWLQKSRKTSFMLLNSTTLKSRIFCSSFSWRENHREMLSNLKKISNHVNIHSTVPWSNLFHSSVALEFQELRQLIRADAGFMLRGIHGWKASLKAELFCVLLRYAEWCTE